MTPISDNRADAIGEIFGRGKALIGMIHVPPLPGAPRFRGGGLAGILDACLRDAEALVTGGMHGLIVENHGDIPFRKPGNIGPETAACLAVVTDRLGQAFDVPLGVNVLANAAIPAFAVAVAAGARFIRVNQWANAYVANEGLIEGEAAEALRYRAALKADAVKVFAFADSHVKHGAHAITADRTIAEVGTPIRLEKLLSTPAGSKVLRLGNETGGPVNGFGERFWKVIGKALPEFVAQMETGVEEVAYLDRYLTTPFTIRLLRETIAAMPGRTGSTVVKVRAAMDSGPRRYDSRLVYDNFPDDDMRKAAIEEVVTGDVQLMPRLAMPHERAFVLRLENKRLLRLYLDQGFGAWRSDAIAFPFGDARRRAAALTTFESKVHVGKLPSLAVLEMPKFA